MTIIAIFALFLFFGGFAIGSCIRITVKTYKNPSVVEVDEAIELIRQANLTINEQNDTIMPVRMFDQKHNINPSRNLHQAMYLLGAYPIREELSGAGEKDQR